MSTHSQCITFKLGSVWYDTIDQPVIPISISNSCSEDVAIEIEIKSAEGREIHSEKLRLKPSEKKSLEITLSIYGNVTLTAVGKLLLSGTTAPLGEYRLRL